MRVICMLRMIREELSLTKAELKRELKMDSRTIDKLLADNEKDPWRLDRDMLYRYVLFAQAHGFEPFRVEPDRIWRSFANEEGVTIFRGPNGADAPVENLLVKYLQRLYSEKTYSTTEPEDVEQAMKQRNCVIIGSPKSNPASEIALALLWGAKPFDHQQKNRERIPIHFIGMAPDHKGSSSILQENSRHGLNILLPSGVRNYLNVDWLPFEKYGPYSGSGQDAAVVVACHRPLGTQNDVSTIVIAGYTGLATLVAAQEATSNKIPDLKIDENPGQPCFAVLKYRYHKRRQYRRTLDGLRTAEEGSSKWGPPWSNFFT